LEYRQKFFGNKTEFYSVLPDFNLFSFNIP